MIFWSIRTLHMKDNHGSGLLVGRYMNYLSPPALWSFSLWGEKSLIPTWQRDRLDMFFALPQIVLNTIESFQMWSWTMAVITHSSSGQPWRLCQSFENGGMVVVFMQVLTEYSWIYISDKCILHLFWPFGTALLTSCVILNSWLYWCIIWYCIILWPCKLPV